MISQFIMLSLVAQGDSKDLPLLSCVILRTYDREGTALPSPAASEHCLLGSSLDSR